MTQFFNDLVYVRNALSYVDFEVGGVSVATTAEDLLGPLVLLACLVVSGKTACKTCYWTCWGLYKTFSLSWKACTWCLKATPKEPRQPSEIETAVLKAFDSPHWDEKGGVLVGLGAHIKLYPSDNTEVYVGGKEVSGYLHPDALASVRDLARSSRDAYVEEKTRKEEADILSSLVQAKVGTVVMSGVNPVLKLK